MFSKETVSAVISIAKRENIPPAALLAVAEVESAGAVFADVDGEKLPVIRWEGHYFYRLLPESKRQKACDAGLAHARAGRIKNPRRQKDRYALLERAKKIDPAAALQSCSWGLGQVMGEHWRSLGYGSVNALVKQAKEGAVGQIELMVRFIKKNNLDGYLRRLQWAAFARAYNGINYHVNRYDIRMAKAYKHWTATTGEANIIYDLQQDLKNLGYHITMVDGIKGPETTAAITQFQKDHDIVANGAFGIETQETLQEILASKQQAALKKRNNKQTVKTGATASVGVGAGAGVALSAPRLLEMMPEDSMPSIWMLLFFGCLCVAAIGLGMMAYQKLRKG